MTTHLIEAHLVNIHEIADLNGFSDRNNTRVAALARGYHKMKLGTTAQVEQVVVGLEEQAERIGGMGGAYASSCAKNLTAAKHAVIDNHQNLLGAYARGEASPAIEELAGLSRDGTGKHTVPGRTSETGFSGETNGNVGEGPFGPREVLRDEGGRPING